MGKYGASQINDSSVHAKTLHTMDRHGPCKLQRKLMPFHLMPSIAGAEDGSNWRDRSAISSPCNKSHIGLLHECSRITETAKEILCEYGLSSGLTQHGANAWVIKMHKYFRRLNVSASGLMRWPREVNNRPTDSIHQAILSVQISSEHDASSDTQPAECQAHIGEGCTVQWCQCWRYAVQ